MVSVDKGEWDKIGTVEEMLRFDGTRLFPERRAYSPTYQLSDAEAKIYDLVVKRFLAIFHPAAEYLVTTRVSKVAGGGTEHHFQTNGKVLVDPGWLAVYGKEAQDEDANLVPVAEGVVRAEPAWAKSKPCSRGPNKVAEANAAIVAIRAYVP